MVWNLSPFVELLNGSDWKFQFFKEGEGIKKVLGEVNWNYEIPAESILQLFLHPHC
jgi:hypothetical protein